MSPTSKTFLDVDALFGVIADILAVTVLIDHREKDLELIEFTHAAMLHNHHLRPGKMVTRRMFVDWFHARKPEIIEKLKTDTDNSYKTGLLVKIADKDLQRRVLSSIFTIAVCDYELHDEESDFIKTALEVWKTGLPTIGEVEVVA